MPVGGRCRDVALQTGYCQERCLTDHSSYGPPLLNLQNGGAIALTTRKSNIAASLAEFDSSLGNHSNSTGCGHYLSTFGQMSTSYLKARNSHSWGFSECLNRNNQEIVGH